MPTGSALSRAETGSRPGSLQATRLACGSQGGGHAEGAAHGSRQSSHVVQIPSLPQRCGARIVPRFLAEDVIWASESDQRDLRMEC